MNLVRLLPRFRKAYRELPVLAQREGWLRAEIEAFQLGRLNAVWEHATAHVPYYRTLKASLGLPPRFSDLAEFRQTVPLLPCERVRAKPRDFLSEVPARGAWHLTGGSTGLPAHFFWADEAHAESRRFAYRFYAAWGADILDRTVFLWGHGASFAPGLPGLLAKVRRPFEDWLRNRLRLSAYHLTSDLLRDYLRRMAAFRPVALYAYSTAAYLLAREAEATHFRCEGLKFIVLTAEPVFPHVVEAVQNAFGVPAVVEYGSSDCGFVVGESTDRTLRVREDGVLLETSPRDDGQWDLVVTLLVNPSFPLIRYVTNDLTDAPIELPDRGFAILKNVTGRSNDLVLSRSGKYVHPTILYEILEYNSIGYYRVHQHADGSLSVVLQRADAAKPIDVSRLKQELEKAVEGYPARLEVLDAIPTSPSGKHRWITSDLTRVSGLPGNGHGRVEEGRVHPIPSGDGACPARTPP